MDHRHVLGSLSAAAVATVLTGCVYQEPFGLPPLSSPGVALGPSTTLYYGYGAYPRYDHYPYDDYPYYYGSGYAGHPYAPLPYHPYPVGPYCRDTNRDGRCDVRPIPPDREQDHDGQVFERLRDVLDARAEAGATTRPPAQTSVPRRPPPPPKVAPPRTAQAPAVRTEPEPTRRPEQSTKQRSPRLPTDEP